MDDRLVIKRSSEGEVLYQLSHSRINIFCIYMLFFFNNLIYDGIRDLNLLESVLMFH